MTRKLTVADISDLRAYERERPAFLHHVMDLKSRRRIGVGPIVTFVFENRDTIRFQVQEMARVEKLITDRLKGRYLVNPRVSVWVDEYRSFFVNGMVEKPGAYPFQPGLNVRKAVSIAGGFKERASVNKIFIVRDKDPAHQPAKVDLNADVAPGDTVTVEESFF